MNHQFFNKLAMVALVTGLVIALAAGAVFAGSSEQKAKIDLPGIVHVKPLACVVNITSRG